MSEIKLPLEIDPLLDGIVIAGHIFIRCTPFPELDEVVRSRDLAVILEEMITNASYVEDDDLGSLRRLRDSLDALIEKYQDALDE